MIRLVKGLTGEEVFSVNMWEGGFRLKVDLNSVGLEYASSLYGENFSEMNGF